MCNHRSHLDASLVKTCVPRSAPRPPGAGNDHSLGARVLRRGGGHIRRFARNGLRVACCSFSSTPGRFRGRRGFGRACFMPASSQIRVSRSSFSRRAPCAEGADEPFSSGNGNSRARASHARSFLCTSREPSTSSARASRGFGSTSDGRGSSLAKLSMWPRLRAPQTSHARFRMRCMPWRRQDYKSWNCRPKSGWITCRITKNIRRRPGRFRFEYDARALTGGRAGNKMPLDEARILKWRKLWLTVLASTGPTPPSSPAPGG